LKSSGQPAQSAYDSTCCRRVVNSTVEKRRQLFIRSHNETLPVAAMRVTNKD
jgi:hypothetical protein